MKTGLLVMMIGMLLLSCCCLVELVDLAEWIFEGDELVWDYDVLPETVDQTGGQFIFSDCPFINPAPDVVRCGYLYVNEVHRNSNSTLIRLAVVIISGVGPEIQPDPILYLSGGPGDSAISELGSWMKSPLRQNRAIILLDQRGTGYSQPHLGCPELSELDWDDDILAAIRRCRQRLTERGVDLSAYNSAASALDITLLRQALGYESWNLLGVSYGSRLALTVMRDQPEGLRSVVLDSVYPPNANAYTEQPYHIAAALLSLFNGCKADPACNRYYPDLADVFIDLLTDLDADPLIFDDDSEWDAYGLLYDLTDLLYVTGAIPLLPYAIYEAYFENYDPLIDLVNGEGDFWSEPLEVDFNEDLYESDGVFYSVECYESKVFGDLEAAWNMLVDFPEVLALPLFYDLETFYETCEIWDVGRADWIENQAVSSQVPTLLLAGEYDPVTPPVWAYLAANTLTNHFYFEMPRGGHALIDSGPCMLAIIQDFINSPDLAPEGDCLVPLDFILP